MNDDGTRRILAAIEALHADVRRFGARSSPLTTAKRERLEALLPAIASRFGSREFTSAEVAADAVVRMVNADGPMRLGNLLADAVELNIGGLTVERIGYERNRSLWRVVRFGDSPGRMPERSVD